MRIRLCLNAYKIKVNLTWYEHIALDGEFDPRKIPVEIVLISMRGPLKVLQGGEWLGRQHTF